MPWNVKSQSTELPETEIKKLELFQLYRQMFKTVEKIKQLENELDLPALDKAILKQKASKS